MTTKRVRAKMTCTEIRQTMGGRNKIVQGKEKWVNEPLYTIEMAPVYEENEEKNKENAAFWAATPSGKLELGCVVREAVEHLEVGKSYYIDITEAAED